MYSLIFRFFWKFLKGDQVARPLNMDQHHQCETVSYNERGTIVTCIASIQVVHFGNRQACREMLIWEGNGSSYDLLA